MRSLGEFGSRVAHQFDRRSVALRPNTDHAPPVILDQPVEPVETHLGTLWVPCSDGEMRALLRDREYWEPATVELVTSLLRPGASFLHVGANVGYFALVANAVAAGRVEIDVVEPHPGLFSLLKANLWRHRIDARAWNVALGETRGLVPLTRTSDGRESYVRVESQPGGTDGCVVPVQPGDELFQYRQFDVVLVSVNGWEFEVIAGMQGVVRNSPATVFIVDFAPSLLRGRNRDPQSIVDRYFEMGFSITVHDIRGLGRCEVGDVVAHCDTAGDEGRVRLLLQRESR